jgi:hypothetical protein
MKPRSKSYEQQKKYGFNIEICIATPLGSNLRVGV